MCFKFCFMGGRETVLLCWLVVLERDATGIVDEKCENNASGMEVLME